MSTTETIHEIKIEDLKARLARNERLTLINVLSEEWVRKSAGARIPGSHWIPVSELDTKAPLLFSKDEPIVVYCGSYECPASGEAARKLQSLGFRNVQAYEGGLKEWGGAGNPLLENEAHEVKDGASCSAGSCG